MKPADEVWIYTYDGQSHHGEYLRTDGNAGDPELVLRSLAEHDHGDTVVVAFGDVDRVATPRLTSKADSAFLFGLIIGGAVLVVWMLLTSPTGF